MAEGNALLSEEFTFESESIGLKNALKAYCPVLDKRFPKIKLKVGVGDECKEIDACPKFLALGSSFFHERITDNYTKEPIELPDLDPNAVQRIIVFLYTGKLHIRQETVQNLLKVALKFEIKEVQSACLKFMSLRLHPNNFWSTWFFAGENGYEDLLDVSSNFLLQNFMTLTDSMDFLSLEFSKVQGILRFLTSNPLTLNGLDRLRAVIKWGKHGERKRKKYLYPLVKEINLVETFDASYIELRDAFLGDTTPLRNCPKCKLYYLELSDLKCLESVQRQNAQEVSVTDSNIILEGNGDTNTIAAKTVIEFEPDEEMIKVDHEPMTIDYSEDNTVGASGPCSPSHDLIPEPVHEETTSKKGIGTSTSKRKGSYNSSSTRKNLTETHSKRSKPDLQSLSTIPNLVENTQPDPPPPSRLLSDYFEDNVLYFPWNGWMGAGALKGGFKFDSNKKTGDESMFTRTTKDVFFEYNFKAQKTEGVHKIKYFPAFMSCRTDSKSVLVHHKDMIYEASGGYRDTEVYENKRGKAFGQKVLQIDEPRDCFGACVCLDYFYVVGGNAFEDSKKRGYLSETSTSNRVDRFSLNTPRKWRIEKMAPMEYPRIFPGVITLDDKIFAIGGIHPEDRQSLASVEIFNPDLGHWENLPEMKKARGFLQAVVLNDEIYAVGGENWYHDDDEEFLVRNVERYNPARNVWMPCKPLLHPRSRGVVVAKEGLIFAIGGDRNSRMAPPSVNEFLSGKKDYHTPLPTVEVYDPRIDTWHEMDWPVGLEPRAELCSALVLNA